MLALEVPFDVKVSPSGTKAAFLVRSANWKDNRYETICYVKDLEDAESIPRRLNRGGSISQVEWLDESTLALLRTVRAGDKTTQVWVYEGLVGEGWQVTDHKKGVGSFKPFANGLLFLANDPEREEKKKRTDAYGQYQHFEQEESASGLFYTSLEALRGFEAQQRSSTEDEAQKLTKPVVELSKLLPEPWHIAFIVPAPDSASVYLNCRRREDLVYWRETGVFRIELDAQAALADYLHRAEEKKKKSGDGEAEPQENGKSEEPEDTAYLGTLTELNLPALCMVSDVSPDSTKLLLTYQDRDTHFYTQSDLWLMDVSAAISATDADSARTQMTSLTSGLDREVMQVYWVPDGIFCSYVDGTVMRIAHFNENGQFAILEFDGLFPANAFHSSTSGKVGFVATNATSFPEACIARPAAEGNDDQENTWIPERLTSYGDQVQDWDLGTVETVRWKSRDGTEIEGVLRKPSSFDPSRRYPLVFVVHGGPTWYSPAYSLTGEDLAYYPSVQFVNQDILVLKPNYRGSIGRGQAFLELNVNNLGVGDLWDLESAIDYLDGLGLIDPQRVGCMGWSQGGYISAFAGLRSNRFKAVSVGAGISDWYTYHVSNDIPDFTNEYLSVSPFRGREIYAETAPISGLAQAQTPVLIQHGSDDLRVPLSNAKELYRGLKEMGVPVELFIFPGMAHPITRPRENHAVLHQNLAWFEHYLLDKDLDLEPA